MGQITDDEIKVAYVRGWSFGISNTFAISAIITMFLSTWIYGFTKINAVLIFGCILYLIDCLNEVADYGNSSELDFIASYYLVMVTTFMHLGEITTSCQRDLKSYSIYPPQYLCLESQIFQ